MGELPVAEAAVVYRAKGKCYPERRFFTLLGACNAMARAAAREKYPCECERETGYYCGCVELYGKLGERYGRLLCRKALRQKRTAEQGANCA